MNSINVNSLVSQLKIMASQAHGNNNDVQNNESFSSMLGDAINNVNELQQKSSELKASFELGEPGVSLTQVMVASQKADISFQALLQVRNKLISAYQEIMRMQI